MENGYNGHNKWSICKYMDTSSTITIIHFNKRMKGFREIDECGRKIQVHGNLIEISILKN